MSDGTAWLEGNTRYLAAALTWLRACMEQCAAEQGEPSASVASPAAVPKDEPKSRWKQFLGRSQDATPNKPPLLLPQGRDVQADERVLEAAKALDAAAAMDPPPALVLLTRRLGLSRFEQQMLILCLGLELDTSIAGLCARCQKDPARPYPTFALAFSLFSDPSWDALSPERPLRFWRLIEITQPAGQPLTTSALRADERIISYCRGLNYLDDRLLPLLTPIDVQAPSPDLPASHRAAVDSITRRWKSGDGSLPIVQLIGADTASKQLIAAEAAAALGLHVYRLPVTLLPAAPADIETFARLWQRECVLLPLALYVDTLGGDSTTGPPPAVSLILDRLEGATFLDVRESMSGFRRPAVFLDASKPTAEEQAAAWTSALGPSAGQIPARLAAQFSLSFTAIRQLAHDALADTSADPASLPDRLWDACLAHTRPQLDVLARRVPALATWDEIVLPDEERAQLRHIAEQVAQRSHVYEDWGFAEKMSRGLGMSVLFAGESGTGKTMAAEVLAHELRMNLYRIDLSAVVSKYIGETEKNLRRLFDAAENGGAILFFDEADALFGRRSEVKDSHDRYANIEINYLLQRMEAYNGLAILATNMKSALDTAFLRRLRFIVRFPFPGVAERKAMWQRVFPADVPKAALDYDRLARLNITGGHIHNIALNAAFLAAGEGAPVTMPLVLAAARSEFKKIERPINEADFRWHERTGAVA